MAWGRLVLLLLVAWQGCVPLREQSFSLFSGIDFGTHEFGHLFFALSGNQFLTVLGGSLMQLLIPVGAALAVRRAGDDVGVAACGVWLAASMFGLAWYVGDARALELDLVSMGGEGDDHDWNYLLREVGWLDRDLMLAGLLRRLGGLVWAGALAWGCWRAWHGGRRATDVG